MKKKPVLSFEKGEDSRGEGSPYIRETNADRKEENDYIREGSLKKEEPAAAGRIFIIVNSKGRKRRMTLGEVCLLTNQVTRLAGFYKWLLHVENDSDDEVHQTILAQETMLTIYNDGEDHGLHSSNITLAFTAENVDQEYERLLEKGVEICEKPVSRPWGARNMSFYDPDGNLVYIRSFPK